MGITRSQIEERVCTTQPSCLAGFRLSRTRLPDALIDAKLNPLKAKYGSLVGDPRDGPHSVWKLACSCGHGTGPFLGYRLSDYSDATDCGDIFISPLAFKCGACETVTELLDTDKHGYHAQFGWSCKVRG
jgi:hypothetical protein